jgi:hypothetical protein
MPRDTICPNGHAFQVSDTESGNERVCPTCGASFVEGPAPQSPTVFPSHAPPSLRGRRGAPSIGALLSLNITRPVMAAGLVLVLLSRGCDMLGQRGVQRAAAQLALAKTAFDDDYETRQIALQQNIESINEQTDKITDKTDRTEADNTRMEDLRKQLTAAEKKVTELRDEQKKKRTVVERTSWRKLEAAARDSAENNQLNAYWREALFVFGSLVLTLGLVAVSWKAEGAERWVCLMMLTIITVSIYIGGVAWIAAIPGR